MLETKEFVQRHKPPGDQEEGLGGLALEEQEQFVQRYDEPRAQGPSCGPRPVQDPAWVQEKANLGKGSALEELKNSSSAAAVRAAASPPPNGAASLPASKPIVALLITIEDVATLTSVSVRTLKRMTSAGGIPGVVRIGRALRFNRRIIEDWIMKGCRAPPRRPR